MDKEGYNHSLVYSYVSAEQGLYEVGEVSADNCKNSYPYAMALKRLFDRVVLKNSKIAYSGIYSETESDEFRNPDYEAPPTVKKVGKQDVLTINTLIEETKTDVNKFLAAYSVGKVEDLSEKQGANAIRLLMKKREKND
jgi:hypothetical protein